MKPSKIEIGKLRTWIWTALAVLVIAPGMALAGQSNNKTKTPPPAPTSRPAASSSTKPTTGAAKGNASNAGAGHANGTQTGTHQPGNQPGTHQPGNQPGTHQPGNQPGPHQPGNQPGPHQPGNQPGPHQPGNQPGPSYGGFVKPVGGHNVEYNKNGHPTVIHAAGGQRIDRGPRGNGVRRTEFHTANGGRVVTEGHRGFVEHSFARGGHNYERRTYVVGGRSYARVYRDYSYRGFAYHRYVPGYYYRPGFYGWAWGGPVAYAWWAGPGPAWYGFYGPYFAMYPSYAAPAFWLTDYVIAANLQAAYEDRQAAAAAQTGGAQQPDQNVASAPTPLTPEIKQAIAEEVKAQLAASQSAAAAQGNPNAASQPNAAEAAPPAMDPAQRVFIVSTNLDVPVNGDECGLTQGDVILRTGDTLDEGGKVGVSVMTSKANDCKSGSATKVAVADLQEMQNSFQEQVESGTQSMAANQGKNGMPAAPAGSTTVANNSEGMAAPDLGAATDVKNQMSAADQAEKEVSQGGAQGSSSLQLDDMGRWAVLDSRLAQMRKRWCGGARVVTRS